MNDSDWANAIMMHSGRLSHAKLTHIWDISSRCRATQSTFLLSGIDASIKSLNKTNTSLYQHLLDLFCQAWPRSDRAPVRLTHEQPLTPAKHCLVYTSASWRPSEDASQCTAGHTWFDQRGNMMNETLLWIHCYSNPAPVSLSLSCRNLAGTGMRYWCTRVRWEYEEVLNIRSYAHHSSNWARPREKRRRLESPEELSLRYCFEYAL